MKEIEVFALKSESFDSDNIKEEILEFSRKSIVFFYDSKKIWIAYKPSWVKVKRRVMYNCSTGNYRLDTLLLPFLHLAIHVSHLFWFLSFFLKFRVKITFSDVSIIAVFFGLLKNFRLIRKTIYFCGDWYEGIANKFSIWSNLGNNYLLPFIDYLACKWSDVTLDISEEISKTRKLFWKRTIPKKHFVFKNLLREKRKIDDKKPRGNNIFFLGTVRTDSGLEIVFQALKEIGKKAGIHLKIAGSPFFFHKILDSKIKQYRVEELVDFVGYADRKNLGRIVSDCFCGVNLITSENSFSKFTYPAKVMDYLQYLLPVIITKNVGPIVEEVKENKLGLVIEPNEQQFNKAVGEIYRKRRQYQQRVIKYIHSRKKDMIKDIFEQLK